MCLIKKPQVWLNKEERFVCGFVLKFLPVFLHLNYSNFIQIASNTRIPKFEYLILVLDFFYDFHEWSLKKNNFHFKNLKITILHHRNLHAY